MLNQVEARVSRAACASFALASVFALLAACGSEPELAPRATPSYSASYPQQGETSPEELVYLSSVVARVRFLSASAGVRNYPSEDGRSPAPVLVFRFRVVEYLKGSGGEELTVRVLAASPQGGGSDYIISPSGDSVIRLSPTPTPNANEALRMAQSKLAERDTRWDDREAIVFLRPSPVSTESGVYEFTYRADWSPGLHNYAITSDYSNSYVPNRAWLPGVAPAGNAPTGDATRDAAPASSSSSEPRYFTGAPAAQPVQPGGVATNFATPTSQSATLSATTPASQSETLSTATPASPSAPPSAISPSTPSISLSDVKALVAANADMVAKAKTVPGYEDCLKAKFEFDGIYKRYPPEMDFIERRIPSGQPAGHRLWPTPQGGDPGIYYDKWWFAGPDSDLFAIRITNDPDNNPATGYATEEVALRPVPEGKYNVYANDQPSTWVPCGYNPEVSLNRREVTIIATAPDGVVHEAFFDPVNMKGGAVGADASNGVLAPPDFTFNGANVSLDSIRWESQAVEMRLSPHTRLGNHHADFIAPDGSVALRLDFDDASETGAGANRALRWKVCVQPWSDGDLLMLRVSESPADLAGATRDAGCAVLATPTPAPGAN